MTPDQRLTVIMTGIALLFTIMVATLGLLVRTVARFTRMEERLADVMNDVREDRRATNERLTYLERSVWPRDQAGAQARPAARGRPRG